jgi:hypothetical protein
MLEVEEVADILGGGTVVARELTKKRSKRQSKRHGKHKQLGFEDLIDQLINSSSATWPAAGPPGPVSWAVTTRSRASGH